MRGVRGSRCRLYVSTSSQILAWSERRVYFGRPGDVSAHTFIVRNFWKAKGSWTIWWDFWRAWSLHMPVEAKIPEEQNLMLWLHAVFLKRPGGWWYERERKQARRAFIYPCEETRQSLLIEASLKTFRNMRRCIFSFGPLSHALKHYLLRTTSATHDRPEKQFWRQKKGSGHVCETTPRPHTSNFA